MGSKISKQKQMFSLLNYKFPNLLDQSLLGSTEEESGKDDQFSTHYSSHLINKVYNFYKSIIQNLSSGLIALDLKGEITFVNNAAADMLGFGREELLGKSSKTLFGADDESQKCHRAIFLPNKKINDREVNLFQKDTKPILVGLSSSHIHDENNNFDGVILLFRDLSEIHHLKLQIEKMERLALIGELSAGIAHEIRNPLAGIKAAAQLLKESGNNNQIQPQIIDRIIREVDRSNKLLQEFFKFARPGKPKLKFHDIEIVIDGVSLLLSPQLKKSKIEFITDFINEIPEVYVDDTQIEQVIINLFLNAIEAMPDGGKLLIKSYNKNINLLNQMEKRFETSNNQLNYVFIEITDTGVGIPVHQIEKIFNPFFTTKQNGLGLGLSICSRLVGENGGNLDVKSKIGEGTCVTVALPAFVHQ
jgi:PAS domain S-box-containing protein